MSQPTPSNGPNKQPTQEELEQQFRHELPDTERPTPAASSFVPKPNPPRLQAWQQGAIEGGVPPVKPVHPPKAFLTAAKVTNECISIPLNADLAPAKATLAFLLSPLQTSLALQKRFADCMALLSYVKREPCQSREVRIVAGISQSWCFLLPGDGTRGMEKATVAEVLRQQADWNLDDAPTENLQLVQRLAGDAAARQWAEDV